MERFAVVNAHADRIEWHGHVATPEGACLIASLNDHDDVRGFRRVRHRYHVGCRVGFLVYRIHPDYEVDDPTDPGEVLALDNYCNERVGYFVMLPEVPT